MLKPVLLGGAGRGLCGAEGRQCGEHLEGQAMETVERPGCFVPASRSVAGMRQVGRGQ